MKKVILMIIIGILYLSCQKTDVAPEGIVEGKFTLSPLCGVVLANADPKNPCGFSDADLDKIYGQYTVQILNATSSKVIAEKKMDRTGIYSFSVPAGNYTLDYSPKITLGNTIKYQPTTLTVAAGQRIISNLDVGTGLR